MTEAVVIREDRRHGMADTRPVQQERRFMRAVVRDDLKECLETQKWKYDNLLQIINAKESRKISVVKLSFGVFAIVAALMTAIATFLMKMGTNPSLEIIEYSLSISLVVVLAGANLMNLTVMRFLVSLKSETMLAMRQLNCVRQSIHSLLYTLVNGSLPSSDFLQNKGSIDNEEDGGIYYTLIGRHVKYPMNNDPLRATYLTKTHTGNYKHDYKALYRSSDLFAICAIIAYTLCLTTAPVALFFFKFYKDRSDFFSGVALAGTIFLSIAFFYVVWRLVRTFFGIVTNPLIPDNG